MPHTRFLKLTDSRGPGSPTNAHRAELFPHAGGAGRVFFAEISRWYAEQLKCLIYIYIVTRTGTLIFCVSEITSEPSGLDPLGNSVFVEIFVEHWSDVQIKGLTPGHKWKN